MQRAILIYNPASGQNSNHRAKVIDTAVSALRSAGVDAEAVATTAPGSAAAQVKELIDQGCDTVIACGGDGTVHEVLQSLVGSPIRLGVIPLGTANALAADLGLPSNPVQAVEKLFHATPIRIPVGRLTYLDSLGATCSRYFTVAAGVGADAQLMYRLDAQLKRRFGYALYAVEGLRILASHPFPTFEAAFTSRGKRKPRVEEVSQILVVRIQDFGGILHHLVPGATLRDDNLRLVAFKTRKRLDYLRFLTAVLFGRQTFTSRIELLDAESVECKPHKGSSTRVYVEADGESLGELPVKIEIVPDALTLLVPSPGA
jgi:YegS/Rv2252/BmrU family lipid kinase